MNRRLGKPESLLVGAPGRKLLAESCVPQLLLAARVALLLQGKSFVENKTAAPCEASHRASRAMTRHQFELECLKTFHIESILMAYELNNRHPART